MIPKLHYALDTLSVEETLDCLKAGVGETADIIEMGSSIILSEGNKIIKYVKTLCISGFDVSVTEKLKLESIQDFAGLPIYSFIVGTAIAKSENPLKQIQLFKKEIEIVFG